MRMRHLTACVAATALMTAAAAAQTSPTAPATPPAAGSQPSMSQPQSSTMPMSGAASQLMTQMSANQMRGSDLMDVDVYGSDNQKIGDIDDVIVSNDGKIEAIVVGVGGFLGIGEKNVAIPYAQVKFLSEAEVDAMASANRPATGTTTAGGVTTPAAPATPPATTGSTSMGTSAAADDDDDGPERAMVSMTRADLQNAPAFRYRGEEARATGTGAGNTAPPAATTRPGTAPQ